MSVDIDAPPLYDPIIKTRGDGASVLSDIWSSYMASFYQTLSGYLSQRGVFLPSLTSSQRDEIQSPQNGQMIYNSTLDTAQYFKVSTGLWVSF